MKEKILLIVGCSHAAGNEIDGTGESEYNREHAFGAKLAERLHRRPINMSLGGLCNQGIARSAMRWIDRHWDKETQDLMVLVCWTERGRMEIPVTQSQMQYYPKGSEKYKLHVNNMYYQMNMSWIGGTPEEQEYLKPYQEFLAENVKFLETLSAMQVVMLQNLFKANDIPYLMCNTMDMFQLGPHISNYTALMDTSKYYNAFDNESSFYWYYRNMGYENVNAQYWHHDETPHELYAQELYDFYRTQR